MTAFAAFLFALSLFYSGAADAAGAKAYVGNFKDNTVSVIDTGEKRVVATIPIPPGPHGLVASPDGRWIYTSSDAASTVSVIDTERDQVVQTIEVGKGPQGLAFTPDGKLLLVGVYEEDRIVMIDAASRKIVAKVAVARPHSIAIDPHGRIAYVASQLPGQFSLAALDIEARAVTAKVPLKNTPRDVEFGPDGNRLYITQAGINAVITLDTATNKVSGQIPTGVSPHYTAFASDGRGYTVVQGPGLITIINPASNTILKSIPVGKSPHWIAVNSQADTAFTTNEGSDDVSVIDLATGTVTTIPVGQAPRKIVVQPTPRKRAAPGSVITIAGFAFAPQTVRAKAGAPVTWINRDGAPHAIAIDNGLHSDQLLPEASYTTKFDREGSYDYHCSIHPYMTGTVVIMR